MVLLDGPCVTKLRRPTSNDRNRRAFAAKTCTSRQRSVTVALLHLDMAHNETGAVRLNDNQRRHYEVLLGRLERSLAQLESAGRGDDARTMLTVADADLPSRFKQESAAVISEARQQLAAIVRSLSLQPRVVSQRRVCRALLTSELNGLTDASSSHLRGFGAVDPSLAEHLDPALERLHATLSGLADTLR
jgi:hypothetical protein